MQSNRLSQFRQAVYADGLAGRRDAQQELLDALLLSGPINSFAELTLSSVFRRQWPSAYKALADGEQDTGRIERRLIRQVPSNVEQRAAEVFALDETAWPRPEAKTLPGRGYVHSTTPAIDGASVVVGHSYSSLAWVEQARTSWALPVSSQRIPPERTASAVGVAQVKRLCQSRAGCDVLDVIVADGRYGNHRFLGPLKAASCGVLARMRCDRVLYGKPGPYQGRGRPRVHGARFGFKEPETWPEPDQRIRLCDERFGEVSLQLWEGLHAKQDAETVFSVVRAQTHIERSKIEHSRPSTLSTPLWLAWQGPPGKKDWPVDELWRYYQKRQSIEASFRFRKQKLHWTLPMLGSIAASERWTRLVDVAQWTLYLARETVEDQPLPWQKAQNRKTPGRVLRGFGGFFTEIGTPAAPPKRRGKSPGWPRGHPRRARDRHPVVKKGRRRRNKQPRAA